MFRNIKNKLDIIFMVKDEDIIFITTTLHSKWLNYQREIIKKLFSDSPHIIIDGGSDWPYAWFYWMKAIKDVPGKWFIHLDEDCFIESREEILRLIEKMDLEGYTLSAVSDAYHHYRGANKVAINSFFMIGNKKDFMEVDFDYSDMNFNLTPEGWRNNKGILFDPEKHSLDFNYPHEIMGNGENLIYEQEPYYALLWKLKERGKKFYYLYPHFDERFKSTNPRIDSDSKDIAIHMWYTRFWDSSMDVHGLPNSERYRRIEEHLKNKK
jgi:hypothetical protein